jgi:hypothetical protein
MLFRALRRRSAAVLAASATTVALASCGGTSIDGDDGGASGTKSDAAGAGAGTGVAGDANGGSAGASGNASTSGGSAGTGVAGNASGGRAGAAVAGNGSAGGEPACEDVKGLVVAELASLQRCTTASECGQVLDIGCGCNGDLVARLDADTEEFAKLAKHPCSPFNGNGCSCREVDGFACVNGVCDWDYADPGPPALCPAPVGKMCVVGTPISSGDLLSAGMPLTLGFQPFGCFSSSCTTTLSAACDAEADGDDFIATAEFCLGGPEDPSTGCTGDCDGSIAAYCTTSHLLTEGTHTVRYEGERALSITFTVPSLVNDGSLCVGMNF